MRTFVSLLTAALAPLVLWAIFQASPQIIHALMAENDPVQVSLGYAERVFDGVLSFEKVLSSRHLDGAPNESCQHVFVRLVPKAPAAPPRAPMRRDRDLRFGGLWRPTPVAFADTPALLPIETCVAFVGRSLSADILRALQGKGAFYYRDLTDGTLHVYAPKVRIAGRVRIAPEGQP